MGCICMYVYIRVCHHMSAILALGGFCLVVHLPRSVLWHVAAPFGRPPSGGSGGTSSFCSCSTRGYACCHLALPSLLSCTLRRRVGRKTSFSKSTKLQRGSRMPESNAKEASSTYQAKGHGHECELSSECRRCSDNGPARSHPGHSLILTCFCY